MRNFKMDCMLFAAGFFLLSGCQMGKNIKGDLCPRSVIGFGARASDDTDDTDAFNKAIKSFEGSPAELLIPSGEYLVKDLTLPENVNLEFANGAVLNVQGRLEVNGGIDAGFQQIFKGNGKVLGKPKVALVYPQWFGVKGDGKNDDSEGMQKAADLAQGSLGRLLSIPQGKYLFKKDITFRCNIDCNGVFIKQIEIDEKKTDYSYSTFCHRHFPVSSPRLIFESDVEPVCLNPKAFWGIKENDFNIPQFENITLADGKSKIYLQEGGTLHFFSSDGFTSRNNNKGDQIYYKWDTCKLTSPKGDVFPEFMFSYDAPPKAPKWRDDKYYKKGDYCESEGSIYKAAWPSGPGSVYKNRYKGVVNIGPVCPGKESYKSFSFKYPDGKPDKIFIWKRVGTFVKYVPPQVPLTVNGLNLEIYLKNSDGKAKRVNEGGNVTVHRSNMTFNNLRISCKSKDATLSNLLSTFQCMNVTYNNSYVSGATNHGLGYNMSNSYCAVVTYNNCISTNCRDAMAGGFGKNITVSGGFYNRIDDHYGKNYVIRNVEINAVSTYIPGYRTPKADQEKWGFKPYYAFAFGGGNIFIENCRIYNCKGVFSARGDSADMFGSVVLKNIDIISDENVYLYYHGIDKEFDFAHKLRTPYNLHIENVCSKNNNPLSIVVRGFDDYSYGPVYVKNCKDIAEVRIEASGESSFVDCGFKNTVFALSANEKLRFSNCIFSGKIKGLKEKNIMSASGNLKRENATITFPLNK